MAIFFLPFFCQRIIFFVSLLPFANLINESCIMIIYWNMLRLFQSLEWVVYKNVGYFLPKKNEEED